VRIGEQPAVPDEPSVSRWIEQLKGNRESAPERLWNHFYTRLMALACRKLRAAPQRVVDEEDVVLSAFETFFRRAKEGRFPQLRDRDDLWCLLVRITERKALNQVRDQRRQKRGGGRVRGESVFLAEHQGEVRPGIDQIAGAEPTPEFAAIAAESFQRLLALLGDDELRRIALLKLEGRTNEEIAAEIGRSLPTVKRRLGIIRDRWRGEEAT